MHSARDAATLAAFCGEILESGELDAKLTPPPVLSAPLQSSADSHSDFQLDSHSDFHSDSQSDSHSDSHSDSARWQRDSAFPRPRDLPMRPTRAQGLEVSRESRPLPKLTQLGSANARAECLARFAHHELQTIELFAWALLRWPSLPGRLAADWLQILAEEQLHCRLYLGRLADCGFELRDFAASDYFWRHVPAIDESAAGPLAFLAAMGLTLEQGNLDFTIVYRDAFARVDDPASADVCEQVHRDEIGHVALAHRWLRKLSAPELTTIEAYEASVPFPLSAARAKSRQFCEEARIHAGLPEDFIRYVRDARSTQETQALPRDARRTSQ